MSSPSVAVLLNGVKITVSTSLPLSASLKGETPCGGHGKCGKCKAKVTGDVSPLTKTEREHLNDEELNSGIRLLCQTYPIGDCEVTTLTHNEEMHILTQGGRTLVSTIPVFQHYGIAIDIGTTTLASRLFDRQGKVLAEQGLCNPQTAYGADILSRIEYAKHDKTALSHALREGICELIHALTVQARIPPAEVDALVLCGNTTMLYLLTETDTEPLSHAPFHLTRSFGEWLSASDLSLHILTPTTKVYLCPVISAFVGADTVCAILATRLTKRDTPSLLVDIGTNGEMALFVDGNLSVTSTAAGPAFEGVGISQGMRGEVGAIDRVSVQNNQLLIHTIGEALPKGICGSGLVDAVACLIRLHLLDESGYLEDEEIALTHTVRITQKDIRQLQLAKSAISAGIHALLCASDLTANRLGNVYICGGFGTYLNLENATQIGLLPEGVQQRCKVMGNSALDGASLLLLCADEFQNALHIASSSRTLDLSTNPIFKEAYMMGMLFPEVDT